MPNSVARSAGHAAHGGQPLIPRSQRPGGRASGSHNETMKGGLAQEAGRKPAGLTAAGPRWQRPGLARSGQARLAPEGGMSSRKLSTAAAVARRQASRGASEPLRWGRSVATAQAIGWGVA